MRLLASGLACVRGAKSIFSGVEFGVRRSEALILVGPNGAGKSSLLRIVAGLLRPAAGRLDLEDGDPELTVPEQAHYLGHRDPLKPSLTVAENLDFWGRFLGGEQGSGPDAALDALGLLALSDIPAGYLSAGQRRRLALARLMIVRRPIWLLDEPSSALDAAGQERLLELMQGHLAAGGLILAATHAPLGLDAAEELRLGGENAVRGEPS
jgi:heme exporter protein A